MIPSIKDGLSKFTFSTAAWYKNVPVDVMIHLISKDRRRYCESSFGVDAAKQLLRALWREA